MIKRLVVAFALISSPALAQSVTPNFTQGSMTSTTTTSTTIDETISIERFGGDYTHITGFNVTPSGTIHDSATTWSITNSGAEFQIEQTTRPAGVIETESITRSIGIESVTNSLSVFSQ